jgi:hypothetical protein
METIDETRGIVRSRNIVQYIEEAEVVCIHDEEGNAVFVFMGEGIETEIAADPFLDLLTQLRNNQIDENQ